MKRCLGFLVASLFFAVPMLVAQDSGSMDHVEFGAFANYYRLTDPGPTRNFIGQGGRVAFGIRPSIQMEAEMAYDFRRDYTSTFQNGVTTTAVPSRLRTLHGFFGPKFQTGSGPVRAFVTGKVGCDNFSITNLNAPTALAWARAQHISRCIRGEELKPLPDRSGCGWRPATTFSSTAALTTI